MFIVKRKNNFNLNYNISVMPNARVGSDAGAEVWTRSGSYTSETEGDMNEPKHTRMRGIPRICRLHIREEFKRFDRCYSY